MINAKTMPSGHACEQALGELETAVNVRSGGRVEVSALRVVNMRSPSYKVLCVLPTPPLRAV